MAAMTNDVIFLIDAIIANDAKRIRKAATAVVVNDTSKKNERYVEDFKARLQKLENPLDAEIPYQVKGMIEVEADDESFHPSRYFMSEREAVVFDHIIKMRRVCRKLAEMDVRYPNTVLLYGESGTGKTTFGRYVASQLNIPFVYLNFSRLTDSLMGKTSRNIADVFSFVRQIDCVFMIDELDCISHVRTCESSGAEQETNRMTVTLLQELDKLGNDLIVIAATNAPEIIDNAIRRRFACIHEVTVPANGTEACAIVMKLLDDIACEYDSADVFRFCYEHEGHSQAWFANKAVEALADSIMHERPLYFGGDKDELGFV